MNSRMVIHRPVHNCSSHPRLRPIYCGHLILPPMSRRQDVLISGRRHGLVAGIEDRSACSLDNRHRLAIRSRIVHGCWLRSGRSRGSRNRSRRSGRSRLNTATRASTRRITLHDGRPATARTAGRRAATASTSATATVIEDHARFAAAVETATAAVTAAAVAGPAAITAAVTGPRSAAAATEPAARTEDMVNQAANGG